MHSKKDSLLVSVLVCFVILGSSGCSGLGSRHKPPQLHSMKQWQVLARDVAGNILSSGFVDTDNEFCLYVQPTPGAFGEGFTKLINAELLKYKKARTDRNSEFGRRLKNFALMQDTDSACYTVEITAQVVRYRKNRDRQYPFGTFTALSSGVLVMREYSTWEEQLILAGGMLADLFVEPPVPDIEGSNSEVLITTSISKENKYLFVRNDIYLLRDVDGHLYDEPRKRAVKKFSITGE